MLCTLYQWQISSALDDGRPLSPRVSRHVAACPQCRRFHERCLGIADGLVREAPDALSPVPPGLKNGILGALDRRRPPMALPSVNVARNLWLRPAMAAGLAAVVIAGFLVFRTPAPAAREMDNPMDMIANLTPLPSTLGLPVAAKNPIVPLHGLLDNPLAAEWTRLADDTRAAAKFVTDCLPVVPSVSSIF